MLIYKHHSLPTVHYQPGGMRPWVVFSSETTQRLLNLRNCFGKYFRSLFAQSSVQSQKRSSRIAHLLRPRQRQSAASGVRHTIPKGAIFGHSCQESFLDKELDWARWVQVFIVCPVLPWIWEQSQPHGQQQTTLTHNRQYTSPQGVKYYWSPVVSRATRPLV